MRIGLWDGLSDDECVIVDRYDNIMAVLQFNVDNVSETIDDNHWFYVLVSDFKPMPTDLTFEVSAYLQVYGYTGTIVGICLYRVELIEEFHRTGKTS